MKTNRNLRCSTARSRRVTLAKYLVCGALTVMLALAQDVSAFRIFGPNPGHLGDYQRSRAPHQTPPFIHWDLREFPNCKIPWAYQTANTPDLDRDPATDDVPAARVVFKAAFKAWADVDDAVIGFDDDVGAPGARSGLSLDDYNLLSFSENAIPGDDDQEIDPGNGKRNSTNINTGLNGLCNTPALLGDTQLIPVGQGKPDTVAIDGGSSLDSATTIGGDDEEGALATVTTGPNGKCESTAGGNDIQIIPFGRGFPNYRCVDTGLDGVSNSTAGGDDQQLIPVGKGLPNQVCITPGVPPAGDGILQTQPRGDDVVVDNTITTGADGICQTKKNNQTDFGASTLALTGLFFNNQSGVIDEVDIVFNTSPVLPSYDEFSWVLKADRGPCDNDWDHSPTGNWEGTEDHDWDDDDNRDFETDLQTVATHEIGHLIGLGHLPGGGSHNDFSNAVMEQKWTIGIGPKHGGWANHTLKDEDKDGCNFLYTPDLGDAPHNDNDYGGEFSTLVHGDANSRTLNGVQLKTPWPGPVHKFGISPRQPRNYTYEWIGTGSTSDVDGECEARIIDQDRPYDDGVRWDPDPVQPGQPLTIYVDVQTAADAVGTPHDYTTHPLYLNVWLDMNANGAWEDPQEHIIHASRNSAGPWTESVTVKAPVDVAGPMWLRARLDWGEDVGKHGLATKLSPLLSLTEGAAQFGEVEDHRIFIDEVPHKMHWPQYPDPNGWDVMATFPRILADDWQCSKSGTVDEIHFWGSWAEDQIGEIDVIHVSIHADVPAGQSPTGYSMPGDLLWERDFLLGAGPGYFTYELAAEGDQGWYDPKPPPLVEPDDHFLYFKYSMVDIPAPFKQREGDIYWLDIQVWTEGEFGWKTSVSRQFNDDAVWGDWSPALDPNEIEWSELRDPFTNESLDLAFYINGQSQPPPTPAVSEWGMVVIVLLLVAGITIKFAWRRPKRTL